MLYFWAMTYHLLEDDQGAFYSGFEDSRIRHANGPGSSDLETVGESRRLQGVSLAPPGPR
jgi:hypothetical protein